MWNYNNQLPGGAVVVVIVDGSVQSVVLPLKFWVRTPFMARYARYNFMW